MKSLHKYKIRGQCLFLVTLEAFFPPLCFYLKVLCWPKSLFGIFCKMLWKNPNERFCQTNIGSTNFPFTVFIYLIQTAVHLGNPSTIFFFSIFQFYFILFLNFTILYWFCHISKWIHHRHTHVPHPEPS